MSYTSSEQLFDAMDVVPNRLRMPYFLPLSFRVLIPAPGENASEHTCTFARSSGCFGIMIWWQMNSFPLRVNVGYNLTDTVRELGLIAVLSTVDSVITHTLRPLPKGMGYDRVGCNDRLLRQQNTLHHSFKSELS